MIGLVAKDFIVFKKICKPAYRLLGIILLLCACIFIPQAAIPYISLLLPLMGVAFLTELVKIEEKSDWKNYLPVLPITDKEIVVGRYLFSGILFVSLSCVDFLALYHCCFYRTFFVHHSCTKPCFRYVLYGAYNLFRCPLGLCFQTVKLHRGNDCRHHGLCGNTVYWS